MIKVFKANDTNYNTNGEVILKPVEAIIYKNIEEEFIEVESPLKYADFLVQDNILLVDTLTGRKAYKIHNPIAGHTIVVKAWLIWQENHSAPADRGAVISHGKNMKDLECQEDWDDVVTKLIPVGHNDIMLPEGYLSVPSPYQRVYEKTIKFELSENLEEEAERLEDEVNNNQSIVAGYENSIAVLNGRINACISAISRLEAEKSALEQRLSQLGNTDPELKEKAVIEAQIPLVVEEISNIGVDKQNIEAALTQTRVDWEKAKSDYASSKDAYDSLIMNDLRQQAQEYLNVNKFPKINYDLEAHLNGVYEIGDTVRVKHPDMRVDLLTQVTAYQLDVLTMRFRKIEFGTLKITLRDVLDSIEEKIEKANETVKKYGNTVTKYRSEYKRDNESLVSKFISEIYGAQNGIYGLMQQNQSVFRQTASEISGTVSRVNADLSEDISSLVIRANQIQSTVQSNYTTLDGKIATNSSKITQTATQIRSEVSTAINGVTQSISVVEQTANKISWLVKSGTSASNFSLTDRVADLVATAININGYVKFTNLSQVNSSTVINGGNITTGTLDCSKITVTNLNAGSITTGNLNASRISGGVLNCNNITVTNLSADSITTGNLNASRISGGTLNCNNITVTNLNANSITSGKLGVEYIGLNNNWVMGAGSSSNALRIGGTYYTWANIVEIGASTFSVQSSYIRIGTGASAMLGFFGSSGSTKTTVSNLGSSPTISDVANKLNSLLNVLRGYGLV